MKLIGLLLLICSSLCAEASRVETFIQQMTLEEKIDYIGGHNFFYIRAIDRLGVPELSMADGPLGVRRIAPSICYPAGIALASGWDTDLATRVGMMLGKDARARGVHILLSPGMNIYRAPMCGRNFEYFGEDPYLASRMAVSVIQGIQSQEVVACAKHFAANNQEWDRNHVSSDVDERTLREIYLPAFEAAVKEAKVGAVMDGYNLVNGEHMTQNRALNVDILKNEWGFSGILMSDWVSTYDGIQAANAGLDIEMPYGTHMNKETLIPAIQAGVVEEKVIDDKVRRILTTAEQFHFFDRPQRDVHASLFNHAGRLVAEEAALSGMVLLKNEGLLPLNKRKIKKIAVIGPRAQSAIVQGGGSSQVTPILSTSFLAGISDALDSHCEILYSAGIFSPSWDFNGFTPTLGSQEKGLRGEYFDNTQFQGAPQLTRVEQPIQFKWKERSYVSGGPVNDYSVRWTGFYTPTNSGAYTATIAGDDGFRLFLDDALIIEGTHYQEKEIELVAGQSYAIRLEYFVEKGSQGIDFAITYGKNGALEHAKEVASMADAVILCVGFDSDSEGEDWDRSFKLPLNQDALIKTVLAANKNSVVVMTAGGNVDMNDWIDDVDALLYAWYPGQEGAKALTKILFGEVSPSGKLPCTFERKVEDRIASSNYYDSNNSKRVSYSEGLFVGYRHFDKSGIEPLFPFGHGLTYTRFSYANLQLNQTGADITVRFDVRNIGSFPAAEVAQVYVRDIHSPVVRPEKELKGFTKVFLNPGETKRVTLTLDKRAFSYYDVEQKDWVVTPGQFAILVGSSSAKIELQKALSL